MNELEQNIKSLEVSLHQPEVRTDRKKLTELLHKEFREVGYSGNEYDLSAILNDLPSRDLEPFSIWSQEFEFTHLSLEIIQVHYLSAHLKNGELSRYARRTSIWVKQGSVWRLRFHQGTPTTSFA